MTYTREQIARAALEAGVGVEKIKEMLKLLPEECSEPEIRKVLTELSGLFLEAENDPLRHRKILGYRS